MKITVVWIGKTASEPVAALIRGYADRIKHYMPFYVLEIPNVKNVNDVDKLRSAEGRLILKNVQHDDVVVLLDDKGKQYTSPEFADYINGRSLASVRNLVFVIGGAYGFSSEVYSRADGFLSLSRMTFSHQIIRPLFFEQIYRAMTILRGEPYHHEESLWSKK